MAVFKSNFYIDKTGKISKITDIYHEDHEKH